MIREIAKSKYWPTQSAPKPRG